MSLVPSLTHGGRPAGSPRTFSSRPRPSTEGRASGSAAQRPGQAVWTPGFGPRVSVSGERGGCLVARFGHG